MENLEKAIELLKKAASLKKIILFGSYARGEARDFSDIDLLVVETGVPNRFSEIVRLNRVLSPLRLNIDLLVLGEAEFQRWSQVPGTVYYEADKEGQVLYDAA